MDPRLNISLKCVTPFTITKRPFSSLLKDSSSNGPPRGWLNLRVRGLPFSQWQRVFFYIQDCHMMKQSKEDINANIFFDFKNAQVQVSQVNESQFQSLK